MNKIYENHDYSLKEEELSHVSGGAQMGDQVYVRCLACGARLTRTPADGVCPHCGNDYRKPLKPAKLD